MLAICQPSSSSGLIHMLFLNGELHLAAPWWQFICWMFKFDNKVWGNCGSSLETHGVAVRIWGRHQDDSIFLLYSPLFVCHWHWDDERGRKKIIEQTHSSFWRVGDMALKKNSLSCQCLHSGDFYTTQDEIRLDYIKLDYNMSSSRLAVTPLGNFRLA